MNELQQKIKDVFEKYFANTPLRHRLADINEKNTDLQRWTSMVKLKEETGDLLASVIQLCTEYGWDYNEVIQSTLEKIDRRQLQYLSMRNKINVAILGGAFDPIHIGHIALAQHVLNTSNMFDEVWIMPCKIHPFGKQMASFLDRMAICRLATQVDGRIRVCDYENTRDLDGTTDDMVQHLLKEEWVKDRYQFSLIIGQDNANAIEKWKNYQRVRQSIPFIVVPRKGYPPIPDAWYLKRPHIYLNGENEIPQLSSTVIRGAIQEGWKALPNESLHPDVIAYIHEHRLYK